MRRSLTTRAAGQDHALFGLGGAYVPGGDASRDDAAPVHRQSAHLRSGALCAQRRGAGGGAALGGRLAYGGLDGFRVSGDGELSEPGYPGRIRQPILIIAAGQDGIVSTPAIDDFSVRLRAGSHLIVPGARHELLMEQDRFRAQVLAAFDAFVPGTPLFR